MVAYPAEVKHEYSIELGNIDAAHPADSLVVAVGREQFCHQTPQQLRKLCKTSQPVLG